VVVVDLGGPGIVVVDDLGGVAVVIVDNDVGDVAALLTSWMLGVCGRC
jgi:hypothetical protein